MKPSILVAEDNSMLRLMITAALKPEGYLVYAAYDDLEVLDMIDQIPLDMVIYHTRRPGMLGMATPIEIRKRLPMMQLILITRQNINEFEQSNFEMMGLGCLSMPFGLFQLRRIVKEHLQRRLPLDIHTRRPISLPVF